ncbi:multidrug ABC transporter ATPase [Nitzschia inconspicua]|uniref:Multidrug ABC transporter ATPase n=1 Tax=Nitzschia inconspicua TaxID=303405 RepID=A0A9K3PR28_9STRA|nr:multidrug ABC transporter ATPase [Nitzschia inconspicua]
MPTPNAIHPHLHLSFEKLTVYVPGVRQKCCSSNKNPAALFLQEYCGLQVEQHDPNYALDGVSGNLSTAQMCLVLGGGSQQSTSTLLRVLSGRSNQTDEVSGNILLNGMPVSQPLQSWRRLCPYISASDTTHSAVLTVRETFQFAAQCTSDGHQTKEEIDGRVNRMLKALALEDVGDTVVGDNNLRGISGGQKRRVTIGEMAIDDQCRLNYVKASPPSDEMIELFDSVLVLTTQGGMAYFWPVDRSELSKVFSLGSSAEPSAGSIADLVEDYRAKADSDVLEDTIQKRYTDSSAGKDLVEKLAKIRSEAPAPKQRNLDQLLPPTKYSTSGWYQFRILSARRIKLIFRNSVTWTRILIAIVFGAVIGSLFSSLEQNIMGALARTGY